MLETDILNSGYSFNRDLSGLATQVDGERWGNVYLEIFACVTGSEEEKKNDRYSFVKEKLKPEKDKSFNLLIKFLAHVAYDFSDSVFFQLCVLTLQVHN